MNKWVVAVSLLCLMLTACKQDVPSQEEIDYSRAQELYAQADYEGAKAVFQALGTYRDSRYILTEIEMVQSYETAMAYLQAGDYPNAYEALCDLRGYKDVDMCLERFQTVEVNEDNWEDFFEIIEIPTSTKNAAGEYERLQISYVLRIKEDVWSQVYDYSANEVKGSFDYAEQLKNLVMDKETGEYMLIGFDDYISDMLHNRMLTVTIKEAEQQKEIAEAITLKGEAIDGPYCWIDISRDFSVREIEGKLYLYQ